MYVCMYVCVVYVCMCVYVCIYVWSYVCMGGYLRVGVYACSHACVLLSQADKRANERTRAGHLCGTSKSCSPGARSCAANTPSPSRGLCCSSSLLMSTACSSCSHILSPLARI